MAVKKSELYSSLWQSCDELRGTMDASQYKDYVLVILFVKYVSDRFGGKPNSLVEVPDGGSFDDLLALRNKPNIGDETNKVIAKLAAANGLDGVITVADFNDPVKLGTGKDMVDLLTNLFNIFNNPALNFSANTAAGDDLLGDAYEYLMRHFATESGKAKGQFYTPAEVSRVLAAVIGLSEASSTDQTIYDPTCGSGSLLLKAHELAYSETGLDLAVYGQENDNATAGLAKMNMILHGVLTAEIAQGNTLSAPQFKGPDDKLQTFDFVVANPPFSTKSWMKGVDVGSDPYKRFEYGTPPPKNGDFAFLLHMLTSLKTTGKAGVVLPHGVLFRGNAEGDIRQELISRGFIKTVIGLPPNLFYGTGIPAAIVVLDKEGADTRTDVFLVDASGGFVKDGPKNRLRERDIHRIIDTVAKRVDVPGFARLVPIAEIADARNDFNLNIPRYVASDGDVDVQDLGGHLHGGIPQRDVDALDSYWSVAPGLRAELFTPASLPGYFELCIPVSDVPGVILNHSQMQAWRADVGQVFDTWEQTHRPALAGIDSDTKPKDLVHGLGESLLKDLATVPLVDSYTVYQSLMEYWASTMRDDVDLVVSQGWAEAAKPVKVTDAKDKDPVDFVVGKERFRSGILPADVLIAAFLSELQEAVDLAAGSLAAASASLEELVDEHGSEGGLLADGLSDSGKVTKKSVADRLKALSGESDVEDELEVLKLAAAALADVESAKKAHKAATDALNAAVKNQYEELDADTVRDLVVDSKWLGRIRGVVAAELARVERGLSERVGVFGERYTAPLPALEAAAETYATVVREHLAGMGVKW